LNGSPACFTDLSNPETKALADALEEVWGKTRFLSAKAAAFPLWQTCKGAWNPIRTDWIWIAG